MRKLLLLLVLGCGGATEPKRAPDGRYDLQTITGNALPTNDVIAGHIRLRDDETFLDVMTYTLDSALVTDTIPGRYAIKADTLHLLYSIGIKTEAPYDGRQFTLWSYALVYRR